MMITSLLPEAHVLEYRMILVYNGRASKSKRGIGVPLAKRRKAAGLS